MLSFVLVSGLRAAFNFPSELRANWAFQLSESHQAEQYLAAMRKWIVVCAIGPLFTLLAPMEFTCFTWRMAAFHLAFGVALSLLLMDIMFFGFRKVPFTCAYFPGKMNLIGLGAIYIFGFTVFSRTMAGLEQWLGEWPPAALAFFVLVVGARLLLAYYNRRQMRQTPMLDYEDAGDPVVRTLGLNDFYIES
jgi:hypothetical protein